jgi:hypothetical protein
MRRALDTSVPDGLFELYDEVMASMNAKSNDAPQSAQRILSWIYYARRTLKMAELREVIAFAPGDRESEEEDWMDADDIIELCESLVTHDKESDTVCFSHELVQKFLQTQCRSYLLPELEIALICLNYFSLDIFKEGPMDEEAAFRERVQQHPFYVYAARYWAWHLREIDAELNDEICNLMIELCRCQTKVDALFQMQTAENLLENWTIGQKQWLPGGSLLHLSAETGLAKLCSWILEHAKKIWVTHCEVNITKK